MAQNDLNVNILAQVKGQEQIAALINRVGALEKETNRLRTANAGLAASTDTVIRNGVRYNNALDAQSRALRQNRQGSQQLGMQINDMATTISTGGSIVQAFNQQLGQLGYAMSMMGGAAGKVGTFLAGPWGAAIVLATAVLGPLITQLFGAKNAADSLSEAEIASREATINMLEAKADLDKALGKNTDSYNIARKAAVALAEAELWSAEAAVIAAEMRIGAALEERKVVRSIKESEGGAIGGTFLEWFGYGDVKGADAEAQKAYTNLNNSKAKLDRAKAALFRGDSGSSGRGSRGRSDNKAAEEARKLRESMARVEKMYAGQFVLEYADMYKKVEKSNENFVKKMSDLDSELTSTSIAESQERMKEIGIIAQVASEKVAVEIDRPMAELRQSFENIGMTVSDAFKGMLTGAMSWKDGMRGIITAVIDELWRLYVVQQIVGMIGRLFGGATTGGMVSGVSAGITQGAGNFFRASGGYVRQGQSYVVGERGPEMFVPTGSGTIIPTKNMPNGNSGGVVIQVDARGSADPVAVRRQVEAGILEAAPAIIAAAEARTVAGLRRPRLGGAMQ